jgi:opine dehydrogenase
MSRVAVLGAGGGGLSAVTELTMRGFDCALWNRGEEAISRIIETGKFGCSGVLGTGETAPVLATRDLGAALDGADVALVVLPTLAHAGVARGLADVGWTGPVVLNPGQTGGALEFRAVFQRLGAKLPPLVEFSTLTYVARKPAPDQVTTSGAAKSVRAAALPGGDDALDWAKRLYPGVDVVRDVLFSSLSNTNLVLHPPGAILGAAWVEQTGGDFTFYREGLTEGVARVMQQLDDERRAVAAAFGHDVASLVGEMARIGTVEAGDAGLPLREAISGGEANARIMAPGSLNHRYYLEDFGHGLLPFTAIAAVAGVATPVASSLLGVGRALVGETLFERGRNAAALGIEGLSIAGLLKIVRG